MRNVSPHPLQGGDPFYRSACQDGVFSNGRCGVRDRGRDGIPFRGHVLRPLVVWQGRAWRTARTHRSVLADVRDALCGGRRPIGCHACLSWPFLQLRGLVRYNLDDRHAIGFGPSFNRVRRAGTHFPSSGRTRIRLSVTADCGPRCPRWTGARWHRGQPTPKHRSYQGITEHRSSHAGIQATYSSGHRR